MLFKKKKQFVVQCLLAGAVMSIQAMAQGIPQLAAGLKAPAKIAFTDDGNLIVFWS